MTGAIEKSSNWIIIGSGNGVSPSQHQVINWTNTELLSVIPLGTHFIEIPIEIKIFSSN